MKPDAGIHFITAIFFALVSWTDQMTTAAIEIQHEYLSDPHKICEAKSSCVGVNPKTAVAAALALIDGDRDEPGGWRNCQCDENCHEYGDCCYDSEYFNALNQESAAARYKCLRTYNDGGAYAVAKCPAEWPNQQARDACETPAGADRMGMLSNPVTSRSTGLTYQNWFCAICNGDVADPVVWDSRLDCKELPEMDAEAERVLLDTLRYSDGRWTVVTDGKPYGCELAIEPPVTLNNSRPCLPDTVTECNPKWKNNDNSTDPIKLDCGSYTTVVFYLNQPYKNFQCAICNNVLVHNLMCQNAPVNTRITISGMGYKSFTKVFSAQKDDDRDECSGSKTFYDKISRTCRDLRIVTMSSARVPLNCSATTAVTKNSSTKPNNGTTACGNTMTITHPVPPDEAFKSALLTYVGLSVSVVFLIVHLVVFAALPEMKNLSGKNLASFCVSLVFTYAAFVSSNWLNGLWCYVNAVLTYYCFLTSFTWMLIMSFDCWRSLRLATVELRVTTGRQTKKFLVYSAVCWLVPAMMAFAVVTADRLPNVPVDIQPVFSSNSCWFSSDKALHLFFTVPLTAIMAVNVLLFVWTAYMIHSSRATIRHVNTRHLRRDFRMYCRMAVLMGLTWITGIVANKMDNRFMWILFVMLNTFQGLFVFLAFTCRRRIFHSLFGHRARHDHSSDPGKGDNHRVTPPSFSWSSTDNTAPISLEKTTDTLY